MQNWGRDREVCNFFCFERFLMVIIGGCMGSYRTTVQALWRDVNKAVIFMSVPYFFQPTLFLWLICTFTTVEHIFLLAYLNPFAIYDQNGEWYLESVWPYTPVSCPAGPPPRFPRSCSHCHPCLPNCDSHWVSRCTVRVKNIINFWG